MFFEVIIGLRFPNVRALLHLHVKAKAVGEKMSLFFMRGSFENQNKSQEIWFPDAEKNDAFILTGHERMVELPLKSHG